MDRGEMWLLIRREIGKRYPDSTDQEIIRNDANSSTITDAILAEIGTPDATGDLLVKVAESGGIPRVELWDGDEEQYGWRAKITTYRPHHRDHYGWGTTPADAIRAALAAAEEGR